MQLLSLEQINLVHLAMDRERSASVQRPMLGQQIEASKAEVARGLFERVDETISQAVTIDGQTYLRSCYKLKSSTTKKQVS
jgi:hypothetical protein